MPNYNHTTLLQFRTALKLAMDSDPTVTNFWPESELDEITRQALLAFGALSGFRKDEIFINTVQTKRLYDIFTDTINISAAPSLTYGDIVKWLNIDLIENISSGSPTSEWFTLAEFLSLIDSKYDIFQLETNAVISKVILNVVAQNNIVKLPNNVLDLVRLKFNYVIDGTSYESILQREDEETISTFDAEALTEEGISLYYSTVYGSPNEVKLYPIPDVTGTLEVLYAGGRDKSVPLTFITPLNLPNNLCPYLKYHVLQDIYNKDGLFNDPARAAYCAKRVAEGMIIGKNYSTILTTKSNGLTIDTDALNKLDDYTDILTPTSDAPNMLGLAGINIFEIDNLPNTDVNSIALIVNNNMPLPFADGDFIEVEVGYIDTIMNYCLHLTQLKCGATEVTGTITYLSEFIKIGLAHNKRLQNKGVSFETLMQRTKLEERQLPRLVSIPESQQQQQQEQQ